MMRGQSSTRAKLILAGCFVIASLQGDPLDSWMVYPGPGTVTSATFGNGLFLAGTSQAIFLSSDGVRWKVSSASEGLGWTSVAFGGGKFLAAGQNGSSKIIQVSTNGWDWRTVWTGSVENIGPVTWNGKGYLGVINASPQSFYGYASVIRSLDGLSWDVPAPTGTGFINAVLSSPEGNWIGVGLSSDPRHDAAEISFSANGVLWNITADGLLNSGLTGIAFGNGRYVAVGQGLGGMGFFYHSANGKAWAAKTIYGYTASSVAFGSGFFVAVCRPYSLDNYRVISSTDGVSWTPRATNLVTLPYFDTVIHGQDKFLAFGGNIVAVADFSPYFESISLKTGEVALHGVVPTGTNVLLESSADLKHWNVMTNLTPIEGKFDSRFARHNQDKDFFRLRLPDGTQ